MITLTCPRLSHGEVDSLEDKKDRLTKGLIKLRATETQVGGLEEELKDRAVEVKEKAEKAPRHVAQ